MSSNVKTSGCRVVLLNDFHAWQETGYSHVVMSMLAKAKYRLEIGIDTRPDARHFIQTNHALGVFRSYQQVSLNSSTKDGSSSTEWVFTSYTSAHHYNASQMDGQALTLGSRNSPGSSTSAVCRLKLLRNRHFSSIRNDLITKKHCFHVTKPTTRAHLKANKYTYLGNSFVLASKIFIHFFNL